jgi:hypothetical protein
LYFQQPADTKHNVVFQCSVLNRHHCCNSDCNLESDMHTLMELCFVYVAFGVSSWMLGSGNWYWKFCVSRWMLRFCIYARWNIHRLWLVQSYSQHRITQAKHCSEFRACSTRSQK